jgi:hypothetical protein
MLSRFIFDQELILIYIYDKYWIYNGIIRRPLVLAPNNDGFLVISLLKTWYGDWAFSNLGSDHDGLTGRRRCGALLPS